LLFDFGLFSVNFIENSKEENGTLFLYKFGLVINSYDLVT